MNGRLPFAEVELAQLLVCLLWLPSEEMKFFSMGMTSCLENLSYPLIVVFVFVFNGPQRPARGFVEWRNTLPSLPAWGDPHGRSRGPACKLSSDPQACPATQVYLCTPNTSILLKITFKLKNKTQFSLMLIRIISVLSFWHDSIFYFP